MRRPENVEKLINFAEVGQFTLPMQLTKAYEVYQQVRAYGDDFEPHQIYHEKIAAADLVAAAHRGEDQSLIELGRKFIASRDEGQAHDWAIVIMREALEVSTEQAESIIDELADEIILEHLQPVHKTVLAEAVEVITATGAEPINELLNSPRLAIYDGRHERATRSALRALAPLSDRFAAILAARDRVNLSGGVNWSTPRHLEYDLDHVFAYLAHPEVLAEGWSIEVVTHLPRPGIPTDPMEKLVWFATTAQPAEPWLPTTAQQDGAWLSLFGDRLQRTKAQQWPANVAQPV
jgi:hypothetical protein